ncbi:SH3-containing GRB2-like protein 3-interacting protein 1 [Striga asiatica]|uniref:SH3-containing GRB2-like protein 3-interacting protein 1 n=1 Tax=Striga asiatica TaxID=4170 RepID=A0A5A7P9D9_STRAF|nr:SH3-containing GRB2-like protein 3-interacting protein 1 [Striga asiatica]
MSRMMLRSNGKPPLPRSPIRLRPRRQALQPINNNPARTPPGSLTKSQLPKYTQDIQSPDLCPEYHTISSELRALAKMVHQELGGPTVANVDSSVLMEPQRRSPLFERGRFYDEYSARRNERLKHKKGEIEYEKKPCYDLGVRVESAKKRESGKFDSRRKAVAAVATAGATPLAERREARTPRYSLRSSSNKVMNKKPPQPLPVPMSVGLSERKVGVRRTRKA